MKATRSIIFGAVAVVGLALPASAQTIVGSSHDFKSETWAQNQICLPCHTPHFSNTAVATAPLWNHELTAGMLYDMNDGGGTVSNRALVAGFGDKTILCLSCHDGTVAIDSFFGGSGGSTYIDDVGTPNGRANVGGGTSATTTGSTLNMSDDHPIGIGALYVAGGGFPDPSPYPLESIDADGNGTPEETTLLGCTTCHNVHNDSGESFLLRTSMTNSELCQDCHNK